MKQLFTSDYSAITFLASFLVGIVACFTGSAALIALAILAFYVSLDVLGWKYIVHGVRRVPPNYATIAGQYLSWMTPMPEVILAYRLIQHGVMIPVLAATWFIFGWQAPVAVLTIWITFGADVLYFLVGKETLPAIDNNTYFRYGHWSGPYGWGVWLASKAAGTPTPAMVAGILYGQALAGTAAAVWILW